ncbi:MAG: hypothetical protein EXR79_02500 [Myxococcales bacterium]|nr:hypothetical protein [Myxococcales bacterium]
MSHHLLERTRLLLALATATASMGACGFIEAAGEITLDEQQIPALKYDMPWPNLDTLVGSALTSANQATASAGVGGIPTSLNAATMAHIQGIMTIDGECRRTFDVGADQLKATKGLVKAVKGEILNCGDPAKRCTDFCKTESGAVFTGIKMVARVTFQLLDKVKSTALKKKLSEVGDPKLSQDPITQVRMRFKQLQFFQKTGEKDAKGVELERNVNHLFAGMQLGVADEGGGNETPIIRGRYLTRITPETPQRFELDPQSPFTINLKKKVLSASETSMDLYVKIAIEQGDLYSVKLGNGGIHLDLQPEIAISALRVIQSL